MTPLPETILGIDTTLMAMSAAVLRDGDVLANQTVRDVRDQAERLPGLIVEVVAEADITFSNIDRIAVTIGPGGFSGLRVGLSHARGMAAVLGCPVVGIGTLEAIAAGAPKDRPIFAAIDARRGEIYVQAFDKDLVSISEPQALTPEQAAQSFPSLQATIVGTGRQLLLDALPVSHNCTDGGTDFPDAADIARRAMHLEVADSPPVPLYIRPPDAKLPNPSRSIHA